MATTIFARIIFSVINIQWLFLCVSGTPRVALIFRGKHITYHHFIKEQQRLLVEPLIENGVTVDIYLITPNSSRWNEMESQYKALSNGVFESFVEKTDYGLDGKHGEEIAQSLNIASNTCQRWQSLSENHFVDVNQCWNAIIVWHFAIAPKISILDFAMESGKLILPWREAHGKLPDSENTQTEKQIRKACAAFQSRYSMDMRGQRSAHVVFWFDGSIFDKLRSTLSTPHEDEAIDAHFMFQPLIDHEMVMYAMRGYWESVPKDPNPVNRFH